MLKQHKSDQNEGNYGKMEAHWDGEFLLVAARGGRGDGGQSQVLSSTSSSTSSTTSVSISLLACHSPPSWIFFWTTGIGFKYFWVISNHVSTSSRIISSSCHCHVSLTVRYSHFLLEEESPDWSNSEPDQTIGELDNKATRSLSSSSSSCSSDQASLVDISKGRPTPGQEWCKKSNQFISYPSPTPP